MAEPVLIAGRYAVLETRSAGEREELRARDRVLGREVLLVRSTTGALAGRPASERALREARALAAVKHHGIQRLLDVLDEPESPVLVLEPVAGEPLASRLEREGRLEPEAARRLALELCDALASVHAAGAVHRDLSAANVLLRADGSACLTGFRLAKPVALSAGTSIQYGRAGGERPAAEAAGLPAHPAPEQFAGEAANARTDLFALGCVLYRALTAREAFAALHEGGWSPPADPRKLVPGTPRELSALVLACLARSPVGRPQSAAELGRALRALESPHAGHAPIRLAWAAAAAAVVVALLLAWRFWPREVADGAERGLAGNARDPGTPYAPGFARSRALLIGIGEAYRANGFPPLANAVRDVDALAAALEARAGEAWDVTRLPEEEATHDGIRAALARLEDGLGPEDRALVYFAGHGIPHPSSGSSGWLIPADARTLEADPTRKNWLHFDTLARFATDAPAKHVLLAMDCCYGGRLAEMRAGSALAYQERFTTQPARVVLAAGRADEPVEDGTGKDHSTFAEVFLAALEDPGRSFTTSQLHAELLRTFTERDLPQTPVLAHLPGISPGEFVFLGR